jgi:hypothetical protein
MPMRGELSSPAIRAGWETRETELSWRQISKRLRNREVLAVLVLAVIGLFGAVLFALLFPLPDDIAAAITQLS